MEYLLLIYSNESDEPKEGTPEGLEHLKGYGEFTQGVAQNGMMKGANALDSASTATTVRVRSGMVETTDGPFAETKEQLGGYYLLECKNLDEAIEQAAKIPSAKIGSIEIRPIKHFE